MGQPRAQEADCLGELSGEGDHQEGPVQLAGDLEERLYPFDSEPPEMDLRPELTPNLDASNRDELLSLIGVAVPNSLQSQTRTYYSDRARGLCGRFCTDPPEALPDSLFKKGSHERETGQDGG